MDNIRVFRQCVKNIIRDNDMTQQDFASSIGVTPATVSYWLSGKKEPAFNNLVSISLTFEISPALLLGIVAFDKPFNKYDK